MKSYSSGMLVACMVTGINKSNRIAIRKKKISWRRGFDDCLTWTCPSISNGQSETTLSTKLYV